MIRVSYRAHGGGVGPHAAVIEVVAILRVGVRVRVRAMVRVRVPGTRRRCRRWRSW